MSQSTQSIVRWRAVLDLFDRVIALPEAERDAEIERCAAEASDLREPLIALLRADRQAISARFIADPPQLPVDAEADADGRSATSGRQIGPYRLISHLGSGGMGEVWLAERADGRFDGRVAIKLLRSFVDPVLGRRFEREGQLLGRLQHVNIARLLDAGSTDDGRLYLVLELVDGLRIDQYCDERRLAITERVHTFLAVCDAVAYAHTHLIVHRDLKPSNILITHDGSAKLLDFGIAKLLADSDEDAGATELTRFAGRAFTPEFAAPEQIYGGAISTQTDVYALGAVLHRLLAGVAPAGTSSTASQAKPPGDAPEIPLMSAALNRRSVDEQTRQSIALQRQTRSDRLTEQLRGDLDVIVAKALKRDAAERYRSVGEMRDDLWRYLHDVPVTARPDSLAYRVRKFAGRHRTGVVIVTAFSAVLFAGIAGTVWQARVAQERSEVADANALRAVEFERRARVEAARAHDGEQLAREQAGRARDSETQARLAESDAESHARRAIAEARTAQKYRFEAELQTRSALTALSRAERASELLSAVFRDHDPLSRDSGSARPVSAWISDAVRNVEQGLSDDRYGQARLLRVLGEAQINLSELEAAKSTLASASNRLAEVRDSTAPVEQGRLLAEVEGLQGALALRELRHGDAERLFTAALRRAEQVDGAQGLSTARIEAQRALALLVLSKPADAKRSIAQAHGILANRLGRGHGETVSALVVRGVIEEQLREVDAGKQSVDEAIAALEKLHGVQDARLIRPLRTRGALLRHSRDFDAGREALVRATTIARAQFGDRHFALADAYSVLAVLERDAERSDAALAALNAAEKALPASELSLRAQVLAARGGTHVELRNAAAAEADLREAVRLRKQQGGLRSGITWFTQAQHASALGQLRRFDEANALFSEASQQLRSLLGADAYQNALIEARWAESLMHEARHGEAVPLWREAVRLSHKTHGREHFGQLSWRLELAHALDRTPEGAAEATAIADALIQDWANNPKGGSEYVRLLLFRCGLFARAGARDEARAFASASAQRVDPAMTLAQRERLRNCAD